MMSQGDILLVPFPFSDQSGRKVRPVIVISNDRFNENSSDLLVVGVTSNISKDRHTLNLDNKDLEEGKLFTKCCIKVENILRMDKQLVVKKIGKIKNEKLEAIRKVIIEIIS
jgi:mRNA interferase MazF